MLLYKTIVLQLLLSEIMCRISLVLSEIVDAPSIVWLLVVAIVTEVAFIFFTIYKFSFDTAVGNVKVGGVGAVVGNSLPGGVKLLV